MTEQDAIDMMCEATQKIDWVNLGRVFSSLGEKGFKWGKFDKARFQPNFVRAWRDRKWLAENAEQLVKAMEILKKNKNAV